MTQIKLRRDTSAAFASSNPILGNGEPAYETDTKKLKIGDGTTAYTQLAYFSAGGGGSTNITATLPLKIVDGVISLEVDGQTIQIVDGKLHANLDELGNEVNNLSSRVTAAEADLANKQDKLTAVTTDTAQTITGQKEFNHTILSLNQDLIRGQQSTSYRNGAGLSMGSNSAGTDGGAFAPQWTVYSTTGNVDRTETIMTTYNQSKLNAVNFNSANKLVRLDSSGKLPAIDGSQLTNIPGGSSEPPVNMVTTDTAQRITGHKSFSGELTIDKIDGDYGLYISTHPLKGAIRFGNTERDVIIAGKGITTEAGNKFLTSGDKETIMGYIMPDYSTRTEVPWGTDNTAPTDGYVEVFGQGDGHTSAFILEYTINGVRTAVSSCYATAANTNFRLPVICPKGTVYRATKGAAGHDLHFISMKGAV